MAKCLKADLKVFTSLGCYGTSVITALTAQNTTGVQGVHCVPPEFVAQQVGTSRLRSYLSVAQLRNILLNSLYGTYTDCCIVSQLKSVWSDTPIKAFKTGMLSSIEVTRTLVDSLRSLASCESDGPTAELPPLVIDPVCVSTSGHTLLDPGAVNIMITYLFPFATLITPNKSEAELVLSHLVKSGDDTGRKELESLEEILSAATQLLASGPKAVLIKGGHLTSSFADIDSLLSAHPNVRVEKDEILGDNMEILLAAGLESDPKNFELVVDVLVERTGGVNGSHNEVTVFARSRIESSSTHGTGCTLSAAIVCGLAKGLSGKPNCRLYKA